MIALQTNRLRTLLSASLMAIAIATVISGCASLKNAVTYHDSVTYQNLTKLKPTVSMLYDTFDEDEVNKAEARAVQLQSAQALAYEEGKGAANKHTVDQFRDIKDMIDAHIAERIKNGKWSKAYIGDKKTHVSEIIDTTIQTEELKNKK